MAKQQSTKQAETPPTYAYRFERDGAQWAVTTDGHYKVLRCGDLVDGVRVRLLIPGLGHRQGTVQALLAGYGPRPRVFVVVALDPPTVRLIKQDHGVAPKVTPVIRHYAPEQLEVVS